MKITLLVLSSGSFKFPAGLTIVQRLLQPYLTSTVMVLTMSLSVQKITISDVSAVVRLDQEMSSGHIISTQEISTLNMV